MGNWAITWRYKPNDKIEDNHIHYDHINDLTKEEALRVFPKLYRYSEYIEIIKIENSRAFEKKILQEKDFFKIPCKKYGEGKQKFKCTWLFEGAHCDYCEFADVKKVSEDGGDAE